MQQICFYEEGKRAVNPIEVSAPRAFPPRVAYGPLAHMPSGAAARSLRYGASAGVLALFASLALSTTALADCASIGGSAYQCSGATSTGQFIPTDNASLTTTSNYSVNSDSIGLYVQGNGALSYTDSKASAITATVGDALSLTAAGAGGSVTITTDGDLTAGAGGLGIAAINNGTGAVLIDTRNGIVTGVAGIVSENHGGTDLTIHTSVVTGLTSNGIVADNREGTGATVVTSDSKVTSTGTGSTGIAIQAIGGTGTKGGVTVEAVDVSGTTLGISATNQGGGLTSVTATGTVEASDGRAISVIANTNGAPTAGTGVKVVTSGEVTGSTEGIYVSNNGTAANSIGVNVTATGTVTSTNYIGINARSGTAATGGVTVNAAAVTGAVTGVYALNRGFGDTGVTVTGPITGAGADGIYAENRATAGDLTVNAKNVIVTGGNGNGISALNGGTGAVLVDTTGGKVTGSMAGISAVNAGTDLTIHTSDVMGQTNNGIVANNLGTGATVVTSNGTVTSTGTGDTGIGIQAVGGTSTSGGVSVEALDVNGTTLGISVTNQGGGKTAVIAHGNVEASNGRGISVIANNNGAATGGSGVSVETSGDVTGFTDAIYVSNNGTAANSTGTSVKANSKVTSETGVGINVRNGTEAIGTINIETDSTGAVDGATTGIVAINRGKGGVVVTTAADVSGATGDGIYAESHAAGFGIWVETRNVTGSAFGIATQNLAAGAPGDSFTEISNDGLVQGGSGAIGAVSSNGHRISIDNYGTLQNTSGLSDALAIRTSGGQASVAQAGILTGTVDLGESAGGSNYVVNPGIWNTAGGTNWLTGTATTNGTGIIRNYNVIIAASSGSTAPQMTTFNGVASFENSGIIEMHNGVVGDQTVITGNYIGEDGSMVSLDTYLAGDGSPSDQIVIDGGSATGSTKLAISNVGGRGAKTAGNGILVVSAINDATTSEGAFSLASAVSVGAFDYNIYRGGIGADASNENWYLRSLGLLSPTAQTALPYADILSNYGQATLGTLQQRTGNRIWPGNLASIAADLPPKQAMGYAPQGPTLVGAGAWGRAAGQYASFDPKTGAPYTQAIGFIQAGYEGVAAEGPAGDLTLGGYATVGTSTARIDVTRDPVTGAARAGGKITTTGYGVGINATWLGNDGLYADAIGQFTWYDSNLSNKNGGNNQGWSTVASLEVGKRFDLGAGWAVVPQAQLAWTHVDFDSFADNLGNRISIGKGDSLEGRLGVRLENLTSWQDANGQTQRLQLYGIANLSYEFLNGTAVKVAGATLEQRNKRLWGEIGAGATYAWNKNWSIYGEADYSAALSSDSGDNYAVKGTAGLRYTW